MTTTHLSDTQAGRGAAYLVYGLYLLSIPSFALFALAGVIATAFSATPDAASAVKRRAG